MYALSLHDVLWALCYRKHRNYIGPGMWPEPMKYNTLIILKWHNSLFLTFRRVPTTKQPIISVI